MEQRYSRTVSATHRSIHRIWLAGDWGLENTDLQCLIMILQGLDKSLSQSGTMAAADVWKKEQISFTGTS